MKKLINGKMYNERTSDIIGTSKKGRGEDLTFETLRKTYRSDYFIVGYGGKNTRWNNGSDVVPLNKEQAEYWLKKNGLEGTSL